MAAALNGGFRLTDPSHNGHYSEGRTVAPLVGGKASLVLHTDGTADVGSWNREVRMDPTVAGPAQGFPLFPDEQVPHSTTSPRPAATWTSRSAVSRYGG